MQRTILFAMMLALSAQPTFAEAEGIKPKLKRVVLQVASPPIANGIPIDTNSIEQEARSWLKRAGIKVVAPVGADPLNTHILDLDVFTFRTDDGNYWSVMRQRCSLIHHQSQTQNEPGMPRLIWSSMRTSGQNGSSELNNMLARTLHGILADVIDEPHVIVKSEKPEWNLRFHNMPIEDLAEGVFNLEMEEMKVRTKPPAPVYPEAAKLRQIQGTVVIEITVGDNGKPIYAYALSGPTELLMTSIRYALAWEFEPMKVNGEARKARFKLTLPFTLK